MSRKPSLRAQKQAIKEEIDRLTALALEGIAELDRLRQPAPTGAEQGVVLEGRFVEGDTIIVDVPHIEE